jgi:hypothetical protein
MPGKEKEIIPNDILL